MLDDDEGMQVLQCVTCPMDLLTMLYKVSGLSDDAFVGVQSAANAGYMHVLLHVATVLAPLKLCQTPQSLCLRNLQPMPPTDRVHSAHQVDHQQYITPAAFLADAHLIIKGAEELYGQTQQTTIAAPAPTTTAAAAAVRAAAHALRGLHPAAGPGEAAGPSAPPTAAAAAAAGEDLGQFYSPDGQGAGSSASGDAAAAAAAAAAEAAGVLDEGCPAAGPLLRALRVSVSKEISRAMELKVGRVEWQL
jgi:hypothetical protein